MIAALLATVLFSLSVIFATRTTRVLGAATANICRLCVAAVLLAAWAHGFGQGLGGGAFGWFFLSGCIGFGFGDLALYLALPRIGPRLTVLLMQCLAAPFAATAEWLWIGTALTVVQMIAAAIILLGVAVAVAPREHQHLTRAVLWMGIGFGVLAALGQGLGAVVSRKAYTVLAVDGILVDGLTATYQRILGGLLFALLPSWWVIRSRQERLSPLMNPSRTLRTGPGRWRQAWVWVLLNSLAGPTLGVACYQWALATTPSGVVLPIVATMPIAVIPLAYLFEGERPTARSLVGGLVAVSGVIALTLSLLGGR